MKKKVYEYGNGYECGYKYEGEYIEQNFWKEKMYYREEKDVIKIVYEIIEEGKEQKEEGFSFPLSKLKAKFSHYNLNRVKEFIKECLELYYKSNKPNKNNTNTNANANTNRNKLDFSQTIFGQKNLIQKYKDLVGNKQIDKIIDDIEMNSVGQWIGLFSNFIEVKISNNDQDIKDQF